MGLEVGSVSCSSFFRGEEEDPEEKIQFKAKIGRCMWKKYSWLACFIFYFEQQLQLMAVNLP